MAALILWVRLPRLHDLCAETWKMGGECSEQKEQCCLGAKDGEKIKDDKHFPVRVGVLTFLIHFSDFFFVLTQLNIGFLPTVYLRAF